MRQRLAALLLLSLSLVGFVSSQEKARLPRVLILGDSISIGYTEPVRKMLEGKAVVLRPNENCQHTGHGLARLDAWLGTGPWAVIHFNWGIWDTHMLDEQNRLVKDNANGKLHIRHTPEQYRQNLTRLVDRLEKTGAKLVWASTTPIMSRTGARFEDIKKLNDVAAEIMKARKIPIDDLYAAVLPRARQWQSGDKVHFTGLGNSELARFVSASILKALND